MRVSPVAALLAAVLLGGCSAQWQTITPQPQTEYDPRAEMEVWAHGVAYRWHGVRVDSSTISGVPYVKPPECDSCRITLPRASVDSARVGHPEAALWNTVLLLGLTGGLVYALTKTSN